MVAREGQRVADVVGPIPQVNRYAESELPTEWGSFHVTVFRTAEGQEHLAIQLGELVGATAAAVRVHSECFTGEVLHSLRCDCREQLAAAFRYIASAGLGTVVYLRQEGRGIGLGNKIRAYALQDRGLDTVDANRFLGFDDDLRGYGAAVAILRALQVSSVRLITNNPSKIAALRAGGITVAGRIASTVLPNQHNRKYLDTKRRRMGHLIEPVAIVPDDD
ncbi:MAG: GTP cyclohydrolase II [Deltaproteobacteria bacterium]|nr:GTP cyclohydrolase II [Deltaproteobacteria bacterium]